MTEEKEYSWQKLAPLWKEFCGVADEYRMIEDKWRFFGHGQFSEALCDTEKTFQSLDMVAEQISGYFEMLRYRRPEKEIYGNILRASKSISVVDLLELRVQIVRRLHELSSYTGTLKMAFSQRIASIAIPQAVSGYPLNLERTIGDEGLLMAADNMAKHYVDCLRFYGRIRWDGFVSFIYPITFKHLHGGFHRPTRFSQLFHLSLSEEGKYIIGSYLALAHEAAHASLYKIHEFELLYRRWFEILWKEFFGDTQTKMTRTGRYFVENPPCAGCPMYEFFNNLIDERQNFQMFRECVSDIIAIKIGGVCTLLLAADLFPNEGTLFRIAFAAGYYSDTKGLFHDLYKEACGLGYKILDGLQEVCEFEESCRFCVGWLMSVAEELGKNTSRDNRSLIKDIMTGQGISYENCAHYLDLKPMYKKNVDISPSVLAHIVRENHIFHISEKTEREVSKNLRKEEPCFEEDPRNVLHVYYKFFRSGKDPSYRTTLQSLAYCKHTDTIR